MDLKTGIQKLQVGLIFYSRYAYAHYSILNFPKIFSLQYMFLLATPKNIFVNLKIIFKN